MIIDIAPLSRLTDKISWMVGTKSLFLLPPKKNYGLHQGKTSCVEARVLN